MNLNLIYDFLIQINLINNRKQKQTNKKRKEAPDEESQTARFEIFEKSLPKLFDCFQVMSEVMQISEQILEDLIESLIESPSVILQTLFENSQFERKIFLWVQSSSINFTQLFLECTREKKHRRNAFLAILFIFGKEETEVFELCKKLMGELKYILFCFYFFTTTNFLTNCTF